MYKVASFTAGRQARLQYSLGAISTFKGTGR
jgi:hypothetical protein